MLLLSSYHSYHCLAKVTHMSILINNMRIIIDQFSALSTDKNFILQYFIWIGLNDCFKNHLINITGSNKLSLQQIEGNIFFAL